MLDLTNTPTLRMTTRLDRPSLLQIATRIHHALLRTIGTGIDVGAMLRQESYATEIIFLCRACSDPELQALGEDFESRAPLSGAVPPQPKARSVVRRKRAHRRVRLDPRHCSAATRIGRRRFRQTTHALHLAFKPSRPSLNAVTAPPPLH